MRFALIGSGSAGNATLIDSGSTALLIDCGYSMREFESRAAALNFDPASLAAILVTHEHEDHAGGVVPLARRYDLPVYATRGTRVAAESRVGPLRDWQQISSHASFRIGDIEICPVPVPHDAREPSQFIFETAMTRLGVLTDLGSLTPHVVAEYRPCDALVLEFNHDPALLAQSAYPAQLKRRIASDYGHFSNAQAISLLQAMRPPRLKRLVAAHLSERTNRPDLVAALLDGRAAELGDFAWSIAAQDRASPWFEG
jgi:phosphoribosyl 1,2-cyclic phosphodiesterase